MLYYLTDQPAGAHWLLPEQRKWLTDRLAAERIQRELVRRYGLAEAMSNGRVWLLTLVYFGQNVAGYGLVIFLPQIIKRFGVGDVQTGLINAIPFVFGALAMYCGACTPTAPGNATCIARPPASCRSLWPGGVRVHR